MAAVARPELRKTGNRPMSKKLVGHSRCFGQRARAGQGQAEAPEL
jgi:hypothetical protein